VERLKFECVFPTQQPVEVELGAGDGSFVVEWARRHPDCNVLAVERLLGRLRKIDRKGRRAGLTNLRAFRIEAGYFLEYLCPLEAVAALHVYFPDPWPKRKQKKNRLVNAPFTNLVARVLQPEGWIFLRTDSVEYFAQMQEVFGANRRFRPGETPPELATLPTDFEREFHARGIPTLRSAWQLVA